MSGDNENGEGPVRACSLCSLGCFGCLRSITNVIVNFPYRESFKALPRYIEDHFVAYLTVFMSFVLSVTSWFEFSLQTSLTVSAYCVVLIYSSGLTCFLPRGYWCAPKRREILPEEQPITERQSGQEANELVREQADVAEQQPPDALDNVEQRRPASTGSVVKAEVHCHEQPSDSNSDEAASPTDELLQPAAPLDLVNIIPRSSTEQSTESTVSTSLE